MCFAVNGNLLSIKVAFVVLAIVSTCVAEQSFFYAFDEAENWVPLGSVTFRTDHIPSTEELAGNSWGNVGRTNTYVETGDSQGSVDIALDEDLETEGKIILKYDVQYRIDDAAHGYFSLGNGTDPDDSIWFGIGGGDFYLGTGTDFSLGSTSMPGGVNVAFSQNGNLPDDRRISLRLGFDIISQSFTNFQLDAENDGSFETEILPTPLSVANLNLTPQDWFVAGFYGRGQTRADDPTVEVLLLLDDLNGDLSFDEHDADLICSAAVTGDTTFDYNGDGSVDLQDAADYADANKSLVGDADFNGAVDFGDFLILSANFAQAGSWSSGDFDCNGQVAFPDFLELGARFGSIISPPELSSVPESSSHLLLLLGLACTRSLRRRR